MQWQGPDCDGQWYRMRAIGRSRRGIEPMGRRGGTGRRAVPGVVAGVSAAGVPRGREGPGPGRVPRPAGALWSPTTAGPVSGDAGTLAGDSVVQGHRMTGGGSIRDGAGALAGLSVVAHHNPPAGS
jgi:hypothetical protein